MRALHHEVIVRWGTVLILLTLAVVSGYAQSTSRAAVASPSKPELEIANHLVNYKYCSDGSMLLTLESEYRNIGNKDLILFKFALPALQYRVSKNMETAKRKHYEQVISPTMGWVPGDTKFGSEPPAEWFVILKPQQSYRPVNTINVLVVTTDTDKRVDKDDLRPGEHVLQLIVQMWPLDHRLARELQTRWQAFGGLWTESLLSMPMKFRVDEPTNRTRVDCSGQ